MSGGVAVDFSALSKAGTSLAAGLEQNRLSGIAQALGAKVQAGDYAGAASDAFAAGDLQTGLSLVKLGESKAQTADFQKTFGGGGLAGVLGGGTGTPTPVAPTSAAGAPSFTDTSGPAGSYLATLRGKESGGSATARNPNSTATGIDQFTASTWAGLAKKYPELGLTPDGRTDVAQSTRAMERFTRDNANALTSAGVPITPGNLYVSHFLGEAGGPRFIRGAMQNPDAPAVSFVTPGAAAANRTIFYNRDGSPKSAGAVYAERTSRFGGGGAPDAAPQRTQVASTDPSFMPRMPNAAAGVSASPTAQVFGGDVKAIPPESDPVPAEQRVQVAQAVPNVLAQAGMKPAAVAQVQAMAPGSPERIQYLVKAMSHPAAPEGFKDAAKAILANELQLSHLSEEQKAYQADVQQGYKGTTMEWRAAKAAALRAPGDDPTVIKEYEYARKQGFQGSFLEFSKAQAEAKSTRVTTNVTPGETEAKKVLGKREAEDHIAVYDDASKAQATLDSARVLKDAISSPTFYSGTMGQLATGAKQALASLGISAPDSAVPNEAFIKVSTKALIDQVGSLSGGFSNGDRQFAEKAGPNIENTPAGNKLIVEMLERAAQRKLQIAKMADDYLAKKPDGAVLDRTFHQMIRRFSEANPVFGGLENMPGVAAAPTGRGRTEPPAGQRDANAGGTLKAAPASEIALAKAAIASGRSAESVMQKMRARGFDPSGL